MEAFDGCFRSCPVYSFIRFSESSISVNTFGGYIVDHTSVMSNSIVTSADDCLEACIRHPYRCVGATYIHSSNICRLHTNRFLMCNAEVKFKKGYTHYQTIPCWKKMLNVQVQETLPTSFPLPEGNENIPKSFTFLVVGGILVL